MAEELPQDVRDMLVLFSSHLHVHLDELPHDGSLATLTLASPYADMLAHLHPILDRYGLPHRAEPWSAFVEGQRP